jgi:hypothetical protein
MSGRAKRFALGLITRYVTLALIIVRQSSLQLLNA